MIATKSDRMMTAFSWGFITLFAAFCLIPFLLMVSGSLTDEQILINEGYSLLPKGLNFEAYRILLQSGALLRSYGITLFITATGTVLGLLVSASLAYSIANRRNRLRHAISFYVYFTMLFNGGMVPFYILISNWLKLSDTLAALILPLAVQPFLVFLMVSFFRTVPEELEEAGRIDGAGEVRIFIQLVLPISKPILATVGLFYALIYWNDWFMGILFLSEENKFPLQMILRRMVSNLEAAKNLIPSGAGIALQAPTYQIRMATTLVTIGPIVLLYPVLQRYFVKGLTIGSVKG
ncbi:putative aldouronate transport system permease protein [Cohnella sp. SGD-V74]|uniref:carbohydrate ABC transporter permease n=1 Tax=unclassified Cohnella TaxID=2636738 RepID=UPI000D491484|nr:MULTISPECIES: carbohydrate ABC transporter permease [unclassified Cohnella]PRX71081.1 putative aldouronate transport system permease protein [Cohnella sp. SGD-V74]